MIANVPFDLAVFLEFDYYMDLNKCIRRAERKYKGVVMKSMKLQFVKQCSLRKRLYTFRGRPEELTFIIDVFAEAAFMTISGIQVLCHNTYNIFVYFNDTDRHRFQRLYEDNLSYQQKFVEDLFAPWCRPYNFLAH